MNSVRFFAVAMLMLAATGASVSAGAEPVRFESGDWPHWGALLGGAPPKPVTLTATWSFPPNAGPKQAAVVVMHGASGIVGGERNLAARLLSEGYAVLMVDRFSRGTSGGDQPQNATADAFAALKAAAADPRIDPKRIAIAGISSGGAPTIGAAIEGLRRKLLPGELRYAAHVGFYPNCTFAMTGPQGSTGAPVLLLMAGNDSNAPAARCQDVVALQKQQMGASPITVRVFDGAPHAFLNSDSSQIRVDANKVDLTRCPLRLFGPGFAGVFRDGQAVAMPLPEIQTVLRDCVRSGALMGYDARAAGQALDEAAAFLARHIGKAS